MNGLPPQSIEPEPVTSSDFKTTSSSTRIFASLLGGTLVWALYFMGVYALNSLACVWNWFPEPSGGAGPGLKVFQLSATIIALGLIALCAFVAFREWRDGRAKNEHEEDEGIAARNPMLAFVTLLLNALYLLIILVWFMPVMVLPVCFR